MKSNLAPRAIFCLTVASFLTVGPIACGSKKSKPAEAASKATVLDPKAAECELRLREQMEGKKIQFKENSAFNAQITRANEGLAKPSDITYRVQQIKDLNKGVRVEHVEKNSEAVAGVAYSLSTFKKDAPQPLMLKLYSIFKKDRSTEELRQTFYVNQACEMSLAETSFETLKEVKGEFEHRRITIDSAGKETPRGGAFKLPENAKLENLTMLFDSMSQFDEGSVYSDVQVGLLTTKIEASPVQQFSRFDYELAMPSRKVTLLADKPVHSVLVAEQTVLSVGLEEGRGMKVWKLPKVAWTKLRLNTFEEPEAAAPTDANAKPAPTSAETNTAQATGASGTTPAAEPAPGTAPATTSATTTSAPASTTGAAPQTSTAATTAAGASPQTSTAATTDTAAEAAASFQKK